MGAHDQRKQHGPDHSAPLDCVPAGMIAILTISVNLVADSFARSRGVSRESGPPMSERVALSVECHGHPDLRRRHRHDVSFQAASGEVLGLVGESGSGKTTLSLTALGYADRGHGSQRSRAVHGTELLSIASQNGSPRAARGSPMCRRTRVSRSTRRCGSTYWSPRCWGAPPPGRLGREDSDVLAKVGLAETGVSGVDFRINSRRPTATLRHRHGPGLRAGGAGHGRTDNGLDVITQALVLDEVSACAGRPASRSCMSPTTSRSSRTSPTASRSCMRDESSSRARLSRGPPCPAIRTRRG